MAKRSSAAPTLFVVAGRRRHPTLFLPRLLQEAAGRAMFNSEEFDRAAQILRHWADLADKGHLTHKETSLDAEFLEKIFGDALGYRSVSENPGDYHREKQFTVPGAGTADGALGQFSTAAAAQPAVIIELKGADTDLDHDKSNGRTPVQQCWDYLSELPETRWGIVSNYVSIRLYHRDRPRRAYEEFTVADFRDPVRLKQFYYVFERHGLIGNRLEQPRALKLLKGSVQQQREVGDKLYNYYSEQRHRLIEALIRDHGFGYDDAIHAAQRLLDRIIFIAFCEDRGLLPDDLIDKTWRSVAPLELATNPRWRRFLDTFRAIDKGHRNLDLPTGYNGGLFRYDKLVDELQLDDRWTDVFKDIGTYDFREEAEINVEVLGHLFERSVTELEKYRVAGLYGLQRDESAAQMPKSAERKRFGIYYTPPEFTRFIVEQTLGKLIAERVTPIADLQKRATALGQLTVCDPACGSGAFLIAAYERFEDAYEEILHEMRRAGMLNEADALEARYPDDILAHCLYGVDLSRESIEITQLALWIRSARKGKPLGDLSRNIVCGNSLVRDRNCHPRAFSWPDEFPQIFKSQRQGFDVVTGNPPWERMKLQEREFFSLTAPDIAAATNAAKRRKLIAAMEQQNPELWARYETAQASAAKTLNYVRSCGHFPLTGKADVNTYMVFAELARQLVAPSGRAGLLVPSGIATDDTTKEFFGSLIRQQSLVALYDFENREKVFPDVDGRFKFSVLIMGGSAVKTETADFVFFAHRMEDLEDRNRHIDLSEKDLKLLNPNTRTCPIFRTKRDAELTKRVYRRVPILVDYKRREGGNPWGADFGTMLHQTNDAELFRTAAELQSEGFRLVGNRFVRRKELYLPLYEAKMIQAYDHRAASVVEAAANWMRQGQTGETSLVEHQNPEFAAQPRFWVARDEVERFIGKRAALLAYKDVTSATNQRTMVAAFVPPVALMNSAPFIHMAETIPPRRQCCLLANLNSLAYDFIARQKVGGLHLNFFIVEQLPTLPPDRYDEPCPWAKRTKLEDWVAERVLKLTCTAEDMIPLAEAAGFRERVHKWKDEERAVLRAELDAAYFVLYGIKRDDVEYILGTFQGVVDEDEAHGGVGMTRQLILDAYDQLNR